MPRPMPLPGYIPDINTPLKGPDPRNHVVAAAAAAPVSQITGITMLPILDQNKTPSCVAHAITKYVMYLIWKNTGKVIQLSPRFLYALCKKYDGMPDADGTSLLTGLKLAQRFGICEDSFFQNDTLLDTKIYQDASLIPQAAYDNAKQYTIGEYKFVQQNPTVATLDGMIAQYGLVLVGITICNSWWTALDGRISWAPSDILPLRPTYAGDPTQSNHLVVLNGYDQFTHMAQDWSAAWGSHGYGWFGFNDFPFLYEAAIITNVNFPPVIIQPPAPDPYQALLDALNRLWAALQGIHS